MIYEFTNQEPTTPEEEKPEGTSTEEEVTSQEGDGGAVEGETTPEQEKQE